MLPKILIGAPISDKHAYCIREYLYMLKNLNYANYNIFLVDNSDTDRFYKLLKKAKIPIVRANYQYESIRKRMVECRNLIREKVLDGKYDYFLNLDQDIIPPKEVIPMFLENNKKVQTGLYYNMFNHGGRKVLLPIAYTWFNEEEKKKIMDNRENLRKQNPKFYNSLVNSNWDFTKARRQLTLEEVKKPQLMKIKSAGSGCLFIHKDVLKKVLFRENLEGGFDDVLFFEDARGIGEDSWLDTRIKCKHLVKKRPWDWTL